MLARPRTPRDKETLIDQLLRQMEVDVQRLWRRSAPWPQPWLGGSVMTGGGGIVPTGSTTSTTTTTTTTTTTSTSTTSTTTTTPGDVACVSCDGGTAPFAWEISVSGVADGFGCSECEGYNGDFTLVNVSSCRWETSEESPCTGGVPAYTLDVTSILIRLTAATPGSGHAVYEKSITSPDCFTSHILTRVSNSSACSSWPATITIHPA